MNEGNGSAAAGTCPVCGAATGASGTLVATEIVVCPDCQSMLVVESLDNGVPIFGEAPKIEEDWGE